MLVERTENLLYEKFCRKDKFRLPEDAGVLTAANDYMFPGLQFLYYSIFLSHVARICVIDCGMTDIQRAWCEAAGMHVIVLKEGDMLFRGSEREMHLWNKSTYVEKCPFRKVLWIDADCVVRDNLGIYFDLLEKGPVFTEDHFAPKTLMANQSLLYMYMPIAPHKRGRIYLNSGVMAFDKERDRGVLDSWKECVKRAAEDEEFKKTIAWHDQGALMWAVEKHGRTNCIRREKALNYPAMKVGGHWGEAQLNPTSFLENLSDDACVIRHFLSHPKPWHHWKRGGLTLDFRDSFSTKVKIFVLGHNQDTLDKVPVRPYLEPIHLDELPLDRFQNNQLAESRIFLAPFMHRVTHDYVGFASARWNEKYGYLGTAKIEDLYQFKSLLRPNVVLAAQRTDNTAGPLGAFDPVNWRAHLEFGHPGITKYLDELANVSGINNRNPSFWANNFVCHRSVFRDFLTHWLDVFFHFYNKYGFHYNFEAADPSRAAAFLMEAITINYFSSRTDLKIIEAYKRDASYRLL